MAATSRRHGRLCDRAEEQTPGDCRRQPFDCAQKVTPRVWGFLIIFTVGALRILPWGYCRKACLLAWVFLGLFLHFCCM